VYFKVLQHCLRQQDPKGVELQCGDLLCLEVYCAASCKVLFVTYLQESRGRTTPIKIGLGTFLFYFIIIQFGFYLSPFVHPISASPMAVSKPIIVLIAGAWHSPWHVNELIALLHPAGYPTVSCALPSLNPKHPQSVDVATDVAFIREKMLSPLLAEGKDILLVPHSYGGCSGGAAAKGLRKSERSAAGQKGDTVSLMFMCLFGQ